jgi:hypothetical protein
MRWIIESGGETNKNPPIMDLAIMPFGFFCVIPYHEAGLR